MGDEFIGVIVDGDMGDGLDVGGGGDCVAVVVVFGFDDEDDDAAVDNEGSGDPPNVP
jgi:hypothetical protein